MTKLSSTMLSVGTLLRRAEDTGAEVSVLVTGHWLEGRVIGFDGLGAVLDGDEQALVRLDAVTAVRFRRAHMEHADSTDARSHGAAGHGPIEAGPVTVPHPSRGEQHVEMLQGLSARPR
ncbi:hypothetical protein AAII07_15555 [Microvirga sp. 0TCS3.31]